MTLSFFIEIDAWKRKGYFELSSKKLSLLIYLANFIKETNFLFINMSHRTNYHDISILFNISFNVNSLIFQLDEIPPR